MKNTAGKFILKNFVKMVLLILQSVLQHLPIQFLPVDPLQANVGLAALGSMSQEQIAKLEEYWGWRTAGSEIPGMAEGFSEGRHGVLFFTGRMWQGNCSKAGKFAFLMIIAWVLSELIGFALGALAGMNRGKFVDKAVKAIVC